MLLFSLFLSLGGAYARNCVKSGYVTSGHRYRHCARKQAAVQSVNRLLNRAVAVPILHGSI